jgi:hypothetical protein
LESFRFIHTGDIHLDSPLKGLSGQQGAAAERIRTATRVAFDNLVSQAIEEQVAFFIIAGDLYDGDWRDYQTGVCTENSDSHVLVMQSAEERL